MTIHAPGANGNAAPVRTIVGASTNLDGPGAIGLGRDGRIYVANYVANTVVVFAKTANGNAAPIRTIGGPATTLDRPEGIVADAAGQIYVSTNEADGSIAVFSATANGNVAPTRLIKGATTKLTYPYGLDLDSSNNLYVANDDDSILVFGPGVTGNVAPKTRLIGSNTKVASPWELTLDADRNLYVANSDTSAVTAYRALVPFAKPSTAGSVAVAGKTKAKSRTVSWSAPTSDGGAPVSYRVVVKKGSKVTLDTTVAPSVRSLKITRVNLKSGAHNVSVTATNRAGSAAAVSTGFSVAKIKPGKVAKLKVKGKAKATKRTIAWVKPAWDGGAKITRYRIVVKKGFRVLFAKTVKASKKSLKVKKAVLRKGKHLVLVKAKNKKGFGANTKVKFRVKK